MNFTRAAREPAHNEGCGPLQKFGRPCSKPLHVPVNCFRVWNRRFREFSSVFATFLAESVAYLDTLSCRITRCSSGLPTTTDDWSINFYQVTRGHGTELAMFKRQTMGQDVIKHMAQIKLEAAVSIISILHHQHLEMYLKFALCWCKCVLYISTVNFVNFLLVL